MDECWGTLGNIFCHHLIIKIGKLRPTCQVTPPPPRCRQRQDQESLRPLGSVGSGLFPPEGGFSSTPGVGGRRVTGGGGSSGGRDHTESREGRGGSLVQGLLGPPKPKDRRSLRTHSNLLPASFQKRPFHVTDKPFALNLDESYSALVPLIYTKVSKKVLLLLL